MKPKFAIRRHLFNSFIALAFGPALLATSASAADQTYDPDNANDVWDTITFNWDTSTATWTNGNNAIFTGTGEAVAVDGTVSVANLTFSTGGFTIAPGIGSFSLAAGTSTVTASTGTSTISALIGGTGVLRKEGAGRLDLTNAGNTFSGGFTSTAGDTYIAGAGAGTAGSPTAGALGTGIVTLAGGRLVHTSETTLYNDFLVQAATNSTIFETASGNNLHLHGNISGPGNLTLDANANYGGTRLYGDNSGYTGTFTVGGGGSARHKFANASAGSANAKWVLNGPTDSASFAFGTGTIHFGELSGGASGIRNNATGTATVSVGALNTNSTWGGNLSNVGSIALTKVGTGTLTVTNTNTYNGATTVIDGTLNVTGAVANSPVTVNNGATFQISGSGKTLNSLTVNAGGTAKVGAVSTISTTAAATGAGALIDLVNASPESLFISGVGGLTLGGATVSDTAAVHLEVGATADSIDVSDDLTVDAGGAVITITNLGLSAGQSYPILSFANGTGAGFATGTGTTVGALTLGNPNLSFGISGELEVTATGVNLITSGATPPTSAYWSGTQGSTWASTSGNNANFTTTAAGTNTFLNVLPGADTMVFFSNNSPSNLTNTLGANFDIDGLTYRASSAAVTTSGTETLTLEAGGITVESGNGGATLAVNNLVLAQNQFWTNDSANPLTVSAATVTGPLAVLTIDGTGSVQLGGTSLTVDALEVQSSLDLKGTAITANLDDSSGNFTNTGTDTILTAANYLDSALDGVISDNGTGSLIQLVKSDTASLTLNGNNTYAGGTILSGGTLVAGHDNAFGTGTVAITNGAAVLDLNGSTIANALTNSGTGTTITNSSVTEATVTSGLNYANAAGFVVSNFTVNGMSDIRWDGAIKRTSGIGIMTKEGDNTLIINNDNDSALIGGMSLQVNAGTVLLGKEVTSFQDLIINGGTLKMDPNYEVVTASIWSGVFANTAIMNGGTWDLNDTGDGFVTNRIKRITGTGGTITNTGTGSSLLILAARDAVAPAWAGNIQDGTGTVALTIANGGAINQVMNFAGSHTYSGDTNIERNVMQAGAANVFSPNSHFILSNNTESKLDLNGFDNTIGSLAGPNASSQVLLGSATLTTGSKDDASTTFAGVISGTGGLTKTGTGTFSLTGPNTYEGDTNVSAGTLAVDGDSIADTAKLAIAVGAVVEVIETAGDVIEDVGSLFIDGVEAAAGTYGATGSGATNIDDTHFAGSGVIRVAAAGGYSDWAEANGASGQTPDQDHDGDGVDNGVEYFMGETGSSFTANPPVVVSGSDRTVTWPKDPAFSGSYVVETSPDLVNWADVTGSVVDIGTSVVYTFPAPSGTLFVRLVVTPN